MIINPTTQGFISDIDLSSDPTILLISPDSNYNKSLALDITKNIKDAVLIEIENEKSVGIDDIRQLKNLLKTKHDETRVVLIQNAHTLTEEAQNSALKLIEENPTNSMFILTAISDSSLIDTLMSRVQIVTIQPPTLKQAKSEYKHITNIDLAYKLADGWPSEYEKFSESTNVEELDIAKEIVSAKKFKRLTLINELADDKTKTLNVLNMMLKIYQQLLRKNLKNDEMRQNYSNSIELIIKTKKNIQGNGSLKGNLNLLFSNL